MSFTRRGLARTKTAKQENWYHPSLTDQSHPFLSTGRAKAAGKFPRTQGPGRSRLPRLAKQLGPPGQRRGIRLRPRKSIGSRGSVARTLAMPRSSVGGGRGGGGREKGGNNPANTVVGVRILFGTPGFFPGWDGYC